jgi:LysR family hydrogen peroxide-inducible transcriptional activator
MTLQQLEYALQLQQSSSYSRAAKILGISQPALSIQIKKLEEELELTLFDRSQKRIRPTYEAQLFLERAQLLLTQMQQLKNLAVELADEYSGEVNIGVIPTLAPYLLPLFIKNLNEKFSKLTINVEEAITEEVIQGIKSGKFDGGIIATPIKSKTNLTTVRLFHEGFMLFVSQDHPLYQRKKVNVSDIPLDDIWLLKEGNCFRDQVDNICEMAQKKEEGHNLFYFESNSIESLCRIVEYKGGVTFLPELTTMSISSEREEMIKELEGPERVREISLVHLPGHVKRRTLEQLSHTIIASLPKSLLEKKDFQAIPTNLEL